jgi:hypothetical protein
MIHRCFTISLSFILRARGTTAEIATVDQSANGTVTGRILAPAVVKPRNLSFCRIHCVRKL